MFRKILYILLVLIFQGKIVAISAQGNLGWMITNIHHNLRNNNRFTERDFRILQNIKEDELALLPDSVIYKYHYLIGSWLHNIDADLEKKTFHIAKALKMIESDYNVVENGIYDIEYLWLSNGMASCYKEAGNIEKAIKRYERTLMRGYLLLDKPSNDNLRNVKALSLYSLGELYAQKKYKREAISCFEQAFEILSNGDEIPAEYIHFPLLLLWEYYNEEKDYTNSIATCKRIIRFLEERHVSMSIECANTYVYLGSNYGSTNELTLAIESYKKALSIYHQINADFAEMETAYGNLWCAYAELGDMNGFEDMKNVFQKQCLPDDKEHYYQTLWAVSTLLPAECAQPCMDELMNGFSELDVTKQVNVLIKLSDTHLPKDSDKALFYSTQGIDIINQSPHRESAPGVLFRLYTIRSLAYQDLKRYNEAVQDAIDALECLEKCPDASDIDKEKILFRITYLYSEAKDFHKMLDNADTLIPLAKHLHGEKSAECLSAMSQKGMALMYIEKYKKSIRIFKSIQSMTGENSINYATCLHNIGRAYMLAADKKKAIEYLAKAKALQLTISGKIDSKTNQYLNELGIYE